MKYGMLCRLKKCRRVATRFYAKKSGTLLLAYCGKHACKALQDERAVIPLGEVAGLRAMEALST